VTGVIGGGKDTQGKVEDAVRAKDATKIKSSAATFQSDATDVQTALQKLSDAVK